jgi:uncharacterized membrane protein
METFNFSKYIKLVYIFRHYKKKNQKTKKQMKKYFDLITSKGNTPTLKIFLMFLFLFFVSDIYAADNYSTHFSSIDLLVVLVFSAGILLIIWALNMAIIAIKAKGQTNQETNSEELPEKIKSKIYELKETKTVLFYCSLLFLFLYVCYALVKGTSLESHTIEWFNLLVRWAHVVFGIAWIGASFYFNFLENSLNRTKDLKDGIAGNLWAIHGGGFYYLEKYKVAPAEIPKDLHWFKYESYFTWLSGFTLLVIVYYLDAKVYLIDPAVLDISQGAAISIGIGTLIFSWIIYDLLCKSSLSKNAVLFGIVFFLFITGIAWFLSHVFSSRAAYIHLGAVLGTIMAGNVFRVIIPSQKAMVNAAKDGKIVDPTLGKNALFRSRQNNYITLPVIFIMISNHFPSTYGSSLNWIVLMGLSLASVLVKHYLNLIEQGEKSVWILPVAVLGIIAMAIITAPQTKSVCKENASVTFAEVNTIITKRCVQCHSSKPTDDLLRVAPNGIMFDDPKNIIKYSERILQRAVITKTMPQANKTNITQEERDVLQCWIEHGAKAE